MEDTNQRKKGIILSYINQILGNIIPIVYTPVMLQLLGKNEYGLFKLAGSATSYLTLATFGIGSAVTRYLIKARIEKGKAAEEKMFGMFQIIFYIISVFTLVVGGILVICLKRIYCSSLNYAELQRMQILVGILTVNTAIGFSATAYSAVVTSHERFVFLQIVNIISTCIMPCVNLLALYLGYASIGMTLSSLALTVIVRILYILYVHRIMKIKPQYSDMPTEILREIVVFSLWVFVANIVGQLYNSTDVMIIGAIPALATSGVAIYNIGATFNSMVFSLSQVVSNMYTPLANKMVFSGTDSVEQTELVIRIGRMQGFLVLLVSSGFVAFGRPFISWYVGDEYKDAYWVAVLMMIPTCIPLLQSVALSITQAKNMHRFRSLVYLFIAILNVVGTYYLVKNWGIIGAALMTGIANIIGQGIIMNWYYWKKVDINIPKFWVEMCKIILIPIVLCMCTLGLSTILDFYNFKIMLGGIFIYTLIYICLNYLFVINDYEKELLSVFLKKTMRKRND